jgi:hypothetical protein
MGAKAAKGIPAAAEEKTWIGLLGFLGYAAYY